MTTRRLRPPLSSRVAGHTGVLVALMAYVVFAVNFGAYFVFGDGAIYFSFDQVLFGDAERGSAYNFGTGLVNAPFYAVAKLAELGGLTAPAGFPAGPSLTQPVITLASISFIGAAGIACAWLIRTLDLPSAGLAIGTAIFGTPLWYYGSFSPSYGHAADALVVTLAAVGLLVVMRRDEMRWLALLGGLLGLAITVRTANVGLVAGCVLGLAFLRRGVRDAAVVSAIAAVTLGVLLLLPLALETPLNVLEDGRTVMGSSADPNAAGGRDVVGFAPLSPLLMLVAPRRGLFLWTPLTLLALAGLVPLLGKPGLRRDYLRVLCAMAVGLLLAHVTVKEWDGGWSFSARYFASLLPLWALGIAGLLQAAAGRWRVAARGAVVLAALWSVFVGMNHAFGVIRQREGVVELADRYLSGQRTPNDFLDLTWSYSRVRHAVGGGGEIETLPTQDRR